jgi:hypothetical protein
MRRLNYTPGPWKSAPGRFPSEPMIMTDTCAVARVYPAPDGESEANAALIEAAPLLLDLAQRLARPSPGDQLTLDDYRVIAAKVLANLEASA